MIKFYATTKTAFDSLIAAAREIGADPKCNYTEQSVELEILTADEFEELATLVEWDFYS